MFNVWPTFIIISHDSPLLQSFYLESRYGGTAADYIPFFIDANNDEKLK